MAIGPPVGGSGKLFQTRKELAVPEKKAFPLRLDPDLYEQLRRWADADLRSVNAQIEYLLRQAVEARFRLSRPPDSEPKED